LQVRSLACGIGYSLGWAADALIGVSFLAITEDEVGKVGVWLVFAGANAVLWLLTYKYLRETKGVTLEVSSKLPS